MEDRVKNFLIKGDNEELVCVYCLTLTEDELKYFAAKSGVNVHDVFEVYQEELQYYCLDGRVYIDTLEKEKLVRNMINSTKND